MSVQIKICGLKDKPSLLSAIRAGADFVGFVDFPKSPRYIEPSGIKTLLPSLPPSVQSVIVTVNPDDAWIDKMNRDISPSFIQLHGHESPGRVMEIRQRCTNTKIIKAIPVRSKDDLGCIMGYLDCVDMFLFDAKPSEDSDLPGGNGVAFDWNIMKEFYLDIPWFLSGGLTCDNVTNAIKQSGAKMVDVSSGVESSAGVKDTALIETFTSHARN